VSYTTAIGIVLAIFAGVVLVFVIGPVAVDGGRQRMRRRRPVVRTVTRVIGPTTLDRRIAELEHDEQERVIEQRIRTRIADQLHQQRHRRGEHQPDTWFWAMTQAERLVRHQKEIR
jgi:hypothetical protein